MGLVNFNNKKIWDPSGGFMDYPLVPPFPAPTPPFYALDKTFSAFKLNYIFSLVMDANIITVGSQKRFQCINPSNYQDQSLTSRLKLVNVTDNQIIPCEITQKLAISGGATIGIWDFTDTEKFTGSTFGFIQINFYPRFLLPYNKQIKLIVQDGQLEEYLTPLFN